MPSQVIPIGRDGVLVSILIRPSDEQVKALRDAGMPIPDPIRTTGFLDTGASHTKIDHSLVHQMKSTNGFIEMAVGVAAPLPSKAYLVEIAIVDRDQMCWVPLHVTEGPVIASGAGVCLGRDFLSTVRLDYDGPNGQATVTW